MTTTTETGQGLAPLVSDEQVMAATALPSDADFVDMVTMRREVFAIRQRYETERVYLFAERAAQTQRIQELEAALAERGSWEPVAPGEYVTPNGAVWQLLPDGQWQVIDVFNIYVDVDAPANMQLMRRRASGEETNE